MREVLQVIGEVGGAVELDQATDERTHDDVQFDEPVHGGHSAGRTELMRDALLAGMPRNSVGPTAHFPSFVTGAGGRQDGTLGRSIADPMKSIPGQIPSASHRPD